MARNVVLLNDTDCEDLGFSPETFSGLLGMPARTLGLLDIPGLAGAIDSGISPSEAIRSVGIQGIIDVTSDLPADVNAAADVIKEVCGTGLVKITGPYATDRSLYGNLLTCEIEPYTIQMLNGWARIALAFTCPFPYQIANNSATIGSIGAAAVDIPLGTAPSRGRDAFAAIITIAGAATTPTLTYKDASGATIATMIFAGYSPLAGDSIIIDCGRRTVQKSVSGVLSNAMDALAVGYDFPALDPADGNVASAAWPKLSVSSGTASIFYYRCWR